MVGENPLPLLPSWTVRMAQPPWEGSPGAQCGSQAGRETWARDKGRREAGRCREGKREEQPVLTNPLIIQTLSSLRATPSPQIPNPTVATILLPSEALPLHIPSPLCLNYGRAPPPLGGSPSSQTQASAQATEQPATGERIPTFPHDAVRVQDLLVKAREGAPQGQALLWSL